MRVITLILLHSAIYYAYLTFNRIIAHENKSRNVIIKKKITLSLLRTRSKQKLSYFY